MIRTLVADLHRHVGETVTIAGWAQTLRLQRALQFVIVRDHTGAVQVTHRRDGTRARGGARRPVRRVRRPGDRPGDGQPGRHRSAASSSSRRRSSVENRAETPLPIDANTGPEGRLDWRFLDVRRRPAARLVFEVQTTVEQAMRAFAYAHGCTEMHTPKLMGTASESGAEVFEVGYFGRSAYLAQSPQFYKQMAIAAGIDRVFEVGPVFRAEPSFTSRHATEFTGVDVELAWIDGVEDVMDFEERMLAHVLAAVAAEHGAAIERALRREGGGADGPVPAGHHGRRAADRGYAGSRDDLDPAGERAVAASVRERTGHEFVFVTQYPASVRPFYHHRPAGSPGLTNSFDLLWQGLEITTGAQREHRYDVLLAQAAEKGLSPEPMRWYLDCFRYGCPPHGGFGLGLGRVLMVLLGLDSIREATFLFRGPNRLTP